MELRERFIARVWAWKQESGSNITRQMRRLGTSANWAYADTEGHRGGYFTMDAKMSRAVAEVFVRLHEEGLIYRGKRLVNWDPKLKYYYQPDTARLTPIPPYYCPTRRGPMRPGKSSRQSR